MANVPRHGEYRTFHHFAGKQGENMAKDPALLFYTSDFLTGTLTMTNEQVGKYIRLLCLQHQKGILTEKDMLVICGSYDEDIWSKFIKSKDGFYNQRLRFEAEKRNNYSLSRAANRKNINEKQNKKHMKKICKSYDKHMENENRNINININEDVNNKKENLFEQFWNIYPKKKSKGQAEKAFLKINPDEQLLATMIATIERAKTQDQQWLKDNGAFIPHPATWLNARGWLDEEPEMHPLAGKVSDKTIHIVKMLEDWRPPV